MTDSKPTAEGVHGVLGPGEGVLYQARGSMMFFKAVAEHDSGDFSLMERTLPAGGRRPPAHRHTNCSEAYFVLDGTVSVNVEGADLSLGPESFLLVPGCSSSTPPPWTRTSPNCTTCGTATHRPPRTRSAR
jgi:mannose-6-phosphate isomerase-like protein (cupin superfamily)